MMLVFAPLPLLFLLIESVTLSSQRLGQRPLRPPIRHRFVVCRIRSLLAGEFATRWARPIWRLRQRMSEPSLTRGRFTSWSWTTTNNLSFNHYSHRYRSIEICYPRSPEASSSVSCWESLPSDSSDGARCENGGPARSHDLASLDFLFPKLYYISPGTGWRGKIIFEERRFVDNTASISEHTRCSLYKFKSSSLSRLSCGYMRRYHSIHVRSYFLQSVNIFFSKK